MGHDVMTLDEANAYLTAPGQIFETERAIVNGIEMTVWKNAPQTLRQMLDLSQHHGDLEFLVYEDQRYTFSQHYAPPVGHGVLGVSDGGRHRYATQRVVDA